MTREFKPGDRVRYLGGSCWEFLRGRKGDHFTIHRHYESETTPGQTYVQIVEGLKVNPTHSQHPHWFALVKSEPERASAQQARRCTVGAKCEPYSCTCRSDDSQAQCNAAAAPDFAVAEAQRGAKLKFRSGCDVVFIAYVPSAKPHCRLVLLNPSTGNIVTRYENGRADDEPQAHANPGDILINRGDAQ